MQQCCLVGKRGRGHGGLPLGKGSGDAWRPRKAGRQVLALLGKRQRLLPPVCAGITGRAPQCLVQSGGRVLRLAAEKRFLPCRCSGLDGQMDRFIHKLVHGRRVSPARRSQALGWAPLLPFDWLSRAARGGRAAKRHFCSLKKADSLPPRLISGRLS